MNNELKEYLDSFIEKFLSLKEVKQYLSLKSEIENSNEIKELSSQVAKAQKDLALSLGKSSYQDKKKEYEQIKLTYDNHPLITNFNVIKEEISSLVNELVLNLKNKSCY